MDMVRKACFRGKQWLLIVALLLCASSSWAQVSTFTLQSAAGNGNGSDFTVVGAGVVTLSIIGNAASDCVVTFNASQDSGAGFKPIQCFDSNTGSYSTSITASGTALFQPVCQLYGGMIQFRAVVSACTGGKTVTVKATSIAGLSPAGSGTVSGTVTANQGTANATPWNSNTAQVNGVATSAGVGPSGTGTQRLVLANNDPCQSSGTPKSSVAINITSATTTSLVAVSGSTAVFVCGFSVTISEVVTTANTIQFEYGTGAACTGPTVLTGLYGAGGVTAGDPIVVTYGGAGSTVFTAPASNGLCAVTAIGASGSFQGVLTYVQQ